MWHFFLGLSISTNIFLVLVAAATPITVRARSRPRTRSCTRSASATRSRSRRTRRSTTRVGRRALMPPPVPMPSAWTVRMTRTTSMLVSIPAVGRACGRCCLTVPGPPGTEHVLSYYYTHMAGSGLVRDMMFRRLTRLCHDQSI